MTTKALDKTHDLIMSTEQQGIARVIKDHYQELMSLGPIPQKDVCRLFRDYLMSNLGLTYLAKLNVLVKERLIATTRESSDDFCLWLDNDVMESVAMLCETDVFDNLKSLSALSEIVVALYSSLNIMDEEDVKEEMAYLFDIPYRLNEMATDSPHIPGFRKHSVKYEEEDKAISKKIVIHETVNSLSVSYKIEIRR